MTCILQKTVNIMISGKKSFCQWLDEMEKHEDVAVRCGVRLARDYMEYLKEENKKLQEENELKNSYLKKLAGR